MHQNDAQNLSQLFIELQSKTLHVYLTHKLQSVSDDSLFINIKHNVSLKTTLYRVYSSELPQQTYLLMSCGVIHTVMLSNLIIPNALYVVNFSRPLFSIQRFQISV